MYFEDNNSCGLGGIGPEGNKCNVSIQEFAIKVT
jgi:hypothetical protein